MLHVIVFCIIKVDAVFSCLPFILSNVIDIDFLFKGLAGDDLPLIYSTMTNLCIWRRDIFQHSCRRFRIIDEWIPLRSMDEVECRRLLLVYEFSRHGEGSDSQRPSDKLFFFLQIRGALHKSRLRMWRSISKKESL